MPQMLCRRGVLRSVSGGVILGLTGMASSCARRDPAKITIANAAGALNLTLAALIKQQKFLEDFDLVPELVAVSDGSKILSGIVGGSVDASMISGFGQVFPAVERGAKLKILAGGALAPTTALFTARPDIHSLKDSRAAPSAPARWGRCFISSPWPCCARKASTLPK
jgi:ABC-type nitrate/sulfonate/bicarbonate transport system substrate-binding protein